MRVRGGLLAVTCSLAMACAAAAGGSKPMSSGKVIVDKVTGFDDPGGTADVTVRFADGSQCHLQRTHAHFDYFAKLLPDEQKQGQLVYAECDDSGTLQDVQLPALRKIEKVADQPEGDRLKVQIFMSPSRHYLRTTRANYDQLRKQLVEAAASDEPMLITVGAGGTEIFDVRKPPAGYDRPVT
jgi:hypothetical protein